MRNKIINFFYKNRIIDSHIGIWDLHLWLYLFATYFDMYIIRISICFKQFCIFAIGFELNKGKDRGLFEFAFKIFNVGFDTSKKHTAEVREWYEKYRLKRTEEFEELKKTLTEEEIEKAIKYKELS